MIDDEDLTTAEVRKCFVNWVNECSGIPEEDLELEFDAWLEDLLSDAVARGHDRGFQEGYDAPHYYSGLREDPNDTR